jgi:hypothetical protein
MDHVRAMKYRRLALQEPDPERARILRLIADEADRGVLATSDWRMTKRPSTVKEERSAMHQSGPLKPDWNGMDDLAPGGPSGWRT